MKNFNKEKAFDDFNKIVSKLSNPDTTISEIGKSILECQNYFQSIYDKGYKDGYKKGIEVNDDVKRLTKNN